MKKKLFMMACLAVLGIQLVKAQIAALALHHSGNVTMYSTQNFSDMMSAAVAGDTIYVSSGSITTDVSITKKLTFIGAGQETIIHGTVSVAIPDSVTLTSRLLQNLRINGDVKVDAPIAGLTIDKCRMNNISFNANIDASSIISCYIGTSLVLSDKVKGLGVYTTKIENVSGECANANEANFLNCNIDNGCPKATYINCVIDLPNNSSSSSFTNCLYSSNPLGSTISCWRNVNLSINSDLDATGVNLDDYIGTDGTVVGVTGTANPHTLTPTTPKVLTHALSVDEVGSTLSVTLTVGN